ncbi:MAG: hypothetical protein ACE144_18055, partial [Thermodesulfobacteriota bacterium]
IFPPDRLSPFLEDRFFHITTRSPGGSPASIFAEAGKPRLSVKPRLVGGELHSSLQNARC